MKTKFTTLCISVTGTLLLLSAFAAQAKGGVALGATRLIYPEGQKEISVALTNASEKTSYLVQSWMADNDNKKSADYVLTPPLFVSKGKSENTLRIMYVGPALPKDRESVVYLHSRAIPSIDKTVLKNGNMLQIAIESVIKVFHRPQGLTTTSEAAIKTLSCSNSGGSLTIKNPSPYFVTMVSLYSGTHKLPNTMVPPKGEKTLSAAGAGKVTYKGINDYGAVTPQFTCGNGAAGSQK